MSLFAQAQKITTTQDIKSEYNKAIASMQSAKAGFDYLSNQMVAMEGVFTSEEIAEVKELQDSIVDLARSLLPTE